MLSVSVPQEANVHDTAKAAIDLPAHLYLFDNTMTRDESLEDDVSKLSPTIGATDTFIR